jgi:hypothetical protein
MEENSPDKTTPVSIGMRKTVVAVAGVPTVIAFVLILLQYKDFIEVETFGIPETPFYVVCFSVCAAFFLLAILTWRCPACGTYLGREFGVSHCPGCGVPFA